MSCPTGTCPLGETCIQRQRLDELVEEIIDWRLADYLGSDGVDAEVGVAEAPTAVFDGPSLTVGGVVRWREYMREEIPPLFGLKFSTGSWNQGFIVQGKEVFLLVTLKKDDQEVLGDPFIRSSVKSAA